MLIRTQAELSKALEWLTKQDLLFYDIETSGLKHYHNEIIGIGVSNFTTGLYVPTRAYNVQTGVLEALPGADDMVKQLLQAMVGKRICAFNGAFDLPFTKHKLAVDLLPSYYCDVLLLKHTVDEEFPFKLKEIAVQVFGYGAASEQRDLQAQLKQRGATKHEIYKADMDIIGRYCIQDCLLTARLYRHYTPLLEQQGLHNFFYIDEVMPLYKHVTIPMEQYGLKLDLPLMHATLAEIKVDIARLEASIQEQIKPMLGKFTVWFLGKDYAPAITGNFGQGIADYAGLQLPRTASGKFSLAKKALEALPDTHFRNVLLGLEHLTADEVSAVQKHMSDAEHGDAPLFNLQSKHHLKKLLFDTLGLEPLSRTDLGNPQVDDDFISTLDFGWARDLTTYNRLQKIRATYIERFLDGAHEGIFYPSFFQHRTVSGRYGSDLQQLPKKVSADTEPSEVIRKYVNRLRDFFIARDGHKLIGDDYDSLEPRLFSHASTDPKLQGIFARGDDFYSTICIGAEKLAEYSAHKKAPNYLGLLAPHRRQFAKGYALGVPYGEESFKLAHELKISQEQAQAIIDNMMQSFEGLAAWMASSRLFMCENGYVKSEAGRIRRMPEVKQIWDKCGTSILDSLQLWKDYANEPAIYADMKKLRKKLKKGMNTAVNFKVQSLAASVVNRAAIAIMREFTSKGMLATICMNVHDEMVVEAPVREVEQACEIMQRNMEGVMKLSVPLIAEPQVATRYGDTK